VKRYQEYSRKKAIITVMFFKKRRHETSSSSSSYFREELNLTQSIKGHKQWILYSAMGRLKEEYSVFYISETGD